MKQVSKMMGGSPQKLPSQDMQQSVNENQQQPKKKSSNIISAVDK